MALKRENENLKFTSHGLRQLFELLRFAPEPLSASVFSYIRSGWAPDAILAVIESESPLSLSSNIPARAASGTTSPSLRLEHELGALYPEAYPPLLPIDAFAMDLSLLGVIQPLRRVSSPTKHLGETSEPLRRPPRPGASAAADMTNNWTRSVPTAPSTSVSAFGTPPDVQSPPTDCHHPRENSAADAQTVNPRLLSLRSSEPLVRYTDERLHLLTIATWTHVAVTDQFAARALSLYFSNDHPILGLFDAELFLEDLVIGRPRFSSSFLVNALMAWSCQAYTHFDPSAADIGFIFFDEAGRQYNQEPVQDTLPTVSAMILLSLTATLHGRDDAAATYLIEGVRMAYRMGLLVEDDDSLLSPLSLGSDEMRTAACSVAWGLFGYQTFYSLYNFQAPMVTRPPWLPIPGEAREASPVAEQGSSTKPATPPYTDGTFTAAMKLWMIVHEMGSAYHDGGRTTTWAEAEHLFHKLLAWAAELPPEQCRGPGADRNVVTLHIWYHTAILDLFRPFVDAVEQLRISGFTSADNGAAGVFAASTKQLGRLAYGYCSEFEASAFTVLWHPGLLYLLNSMLRDYSTSYAQFYFVICMRGYQRLSRCYPLMRGIASAILAVALRVGAMLPVNAYRMFLEVFGEDDLPSDPTALLHPVFEVGHRQRREALSKRRREYLVSRYPVDLDPVMTDPESAALGALARDFERGLAQSLQA